MTFDLKFRRFIITATMMIALATVASIITGRSLPFNLACALLGSVLATIAYEQHAARRATERSPLRPGPDPTTGEQHDGDHPLGE